MRLLFAALILSLAGGSNARAQNQAGVNPVEVARRAFEQRKPDLALSLLNDAEKTEKLTAKGLDLRGCILLEQQKYDEAAAAFKAAHEADPGIFAPELHLGDVLLRQGKWGEARLAYQSLMHDTNILVVSERLRYGVLISYLGEKRDDHAQTALERLTFPTESAAYYYAQAAWAFAHGSKAGGEKWLRTAGEIFDAKATAWFARPLHELGWIKIKPPLVAD